MMIAAALIACLYLTGLLVLVVALLRAPEGFEDDDGFHTGRRPFEDEVSL